MCDLEHSLHLAGEAFRRWTTHVMAQIGSPGLSPLGILFVIELGRDTRPKTFIELCASTAVEETHLAHYALRKLRQDGLVTIGRRGKEKLVELTERGWTLYRDFQLRSKEGQARLSPPAIRLDDILPLIGGLNKVFTHYDEARRFPAAPERPLPPKSVRRTTTSREPR